MANEYQVVFRGTVNNQAVNHVRYYRASNTVDTTDIQNFADEIGDVFLNSYVNLFTSVITYDDLYIRPNIVGALGASFIPASWPFQGGGVGDLLPPYVTVNQRLRSGGLPHPNKGMVQLPPPIESAQSSGVLTVTSRGTYNVAGAMWTETIVPFGVITWDPILFSESYAAYSDVNVSEVIPNTGSRGQRKYGRGK